MKPENPAGKPGKSMPSRNRARARPFSPGRSGARPQQKSPYIYEGSPASEDGENPAPPPETLYLKLCQRETLYAAFREVRRGRGESARKWTGAADRVSLELFERHLDQNITQMRYRLLSGRYTPDPIVNFRLPKPGGGHRQLSVLTVRDRVLQRAALGLVAPLFEPEFLPCSYGFRPDRSTRDALAEVEKAYREGYRWVVDADIEAFFDNIERGRLVRLLREKISDPYFIYLLKLWLNNSRQIGREPEAPEKPPAPVPARKEAEAGLGDKLSELTRVALENGLDWSISALGGESYSGKSGYYGRYREEEEEDFRPRGDNFTREAIKRLGVDGALAGLWLAKGFVRKGGIFGLAGKAGVAVGAASAAGYLAKRVWRATRKEREAVSGEPEGTGIPVPPRQRGIAQGSILSPLYSNLYLHEFDRRLSARGYRLVRFADDLVILCRSSREAEEALSFAELALGSLGLSFKPAKTGIRPLEKGFRFLGAELGQDGRFNSKDPDNPRQANPAEWARRVGAKWLRKKAPPGVVQKGRQVKLEIVEEEEE
jgi:RNA-directed DNA polymerase